MANNDELKGKVNEAKGKVTDDEGQNPTRFR